MADFVSGIVIGTLLGTLFRWWAFPKPPKIRTFTAARPPEPQFNAVFS
ncbi:hypothetical protein [Amycolatopsis sp. lyj-109]